MKAVVKGVTVEGTPSEIAELIEQLPSTTKSLDLGRLYDPPRPVRTTKIPEIDEVKQYIKNKTDYINSWGDLQDHFLGGRLKSRGKTEDDYHLFQTRYQLAKKKIETEENGRFVREKGGEYKFVKS